MEIPCSDPDALVAFCRPFLSGEKKPATAAELMASRYVAYTLADIDYLVNSHNPETRAQTDRQATETWAKGAEWHGLEILSTDKGGPEDDEGQVEFIARYAIKGAEYTHHERAQFKREDDRWYFVDGQRVTAPPVRRSSPKVGRNDPCPCGSGKKHKKCCAA